MYSWCNYGSARKEVRTLVSPYSPVMWRLLAVGGTFSSWDVCGSPAVTSKTMCSRFTAACCSLPVIPVTAA